MKNIIIDNLKRFGKVTFWKLLGRLVELTVLYWIGYSLGLTIVKIH